jgi:hypothetical protein
MNNSNNNFSLIRNGEINRIGPQYISPIYYNEYKIAEKMAELGAYEDPAEKETINNTQLWTRDKNAYVHKYCNLLVNLDFKRQICIIGLDSLILNMDKIQKIYDNTDEPVDFILLDNKCPIEYLWKQLDSYKFEKMKCYSFVDTSSDLLVSYFKTMYLSCDQFEIVKSGYICRPKYNTQFTSRSQVINSLTKSDQKYLEIGVEYGQTFLQTHFKPENKMGVDPDPKFDIIGKEFKFSKATSDAFFQDSFQDLKKDRYDVIFIDGMHQSEYFLRDFNNSINVLEEGGALFIDDILPLTYNEQLKIPRKYYYENGILKYGEEWTGDIWKVVYHILKNYSQHILVTKYFYNASYRGVLHLKLKNAFEIPDSEIDVINSYDYFTDFPVYLELLNL